MRSRPQTIYRYKLSLGDPLRGTERVNISVIARATFSSTDIHNTHYWFEWREGNHLKRKEESHITLDLHDAHRFCLKKFAADLNWLVNETDILEDKETSTEVNWIRPPRTTS